MPTAGAWWMNPLWRWPLSSLFWHSLGLAGICWGWLPMNLPRRFWIERAAQVNGEMFPRSVTLKKRQASLFSAGGYVSVSLASESVGSCGQGHFQRWLRPFDHAADGVVFVTSAERQWAAWCPEGGSGDRLSNLLLLSRTALNFRRSPATPDLHVAGSAAG